VQEVVHKPVQEPLHVCGFGKVLFSDASKLLGNTMAPITGNILFAAFLKKLRLDNNSSLFIRNLFDIC
jgi:hypothetical protein